MKILHIINDLGVGGAEKLIDESLPILNQSNEVNVSLLLLSNKSSIFNENLKEHGIKVNVVPFNNIRSFKNIKYIRNHIIQGGYDIVHSHLFPSNYFTSIASKLIFKNKPKFITTEHNTHNKRRNKLYLKPFEKFIYFNYDTIISISEDTRSNLMKWIKPKNKNKYVVIENGINLNDFMNAYPYKKTEFNRNFNEKSKLICMVGSFSKQKDQATIIRAMKSLSKDTFLLLVGDGLLRLENEKLAKFLKVEDRVSFLGIRNDVPNILKTSDIIIVSSHWEGFGLVAAEGMAAGKPVIASDVPGLSDVIRGAGLLFEKENEKELSDIINTLLSNKNEYHKYSGKCFEHSFKYDIYRMVKEYIEVYSINDE